MRKTFSRGVLAAILFVVGAVSSDAAVRQVLVLHSFERGNMSQDYFHRNFRIDLDERLGAPVSVVEFVVSPAGFIVPPEEAILDYLLTAFGDRPKPNLIVTI